MSCTCSFDNICFDIQVNTHEKVMGNLLCELRFCSLHIAKSSLFNCDQIFGLNLLYFMMGTLQGPMGVVGIMTSNFINYTGSCMSTHFLREECDVFSSCHSKAVRMSLFHFLFSM